MKLNYLFVDYYYDLFSKLYAEKLSMYSDKESSFVKKVLFSNKIFSFQRIDTGKEG